MFEEILEHSLLMMKNNGQIMIKLMIFECCGYLQMNEVVKIGLTSSKISCVNDDSDQQLLRHTRAPRLLFPLHC